MAAQADLCLPQLDESNPNTVNWPRNGLDLRRYQPLKGGSVIWVGEYRGLIFKVRSFGELTVEGSLQKFWLGNNHSAFSLSIVNHAVTNLSSFIGLPAKDIPIVKVEFGYNLIGHPMGNEWVTLAGMLAYRLAPASMMHQQSHYGKLWKQARSSLKIYDKRAQVWYMEKTRLTEPVTRLEFATRDLSYRPRNLAELTDLATIYRFHELAKRWVRKISYPPYPIDGHKLTDRERTLLYASKDPAYWQGFKLPKQKSKYRQKIKAILTKCENPVIELVNAMDTYFKTMTHEVSCPGE